MPTQDPGKVKTFNFPTGILEIDTNRFSIGMTKKMNRVLGQARSKKSAARDIPIEVGQTEEAWAKANEKELKSRSDASQLRRSDEDIDAYLSRINESNMVSQDYARDIVIGLATVFGQTLSFTDDEWETVHWPRLRDWLHDVFSEAGVPATEFNPK